MKTNKTLIITFFVSCLCGGFGAPLLSATSDETITWTEVKTDKHVILMNRDHGIVVLNKEGLKYHPNGGGVHTGTLGNVSTWAHGKHVFNFKEGSLITFRTNGMVKHGTLAFNTLWSTPSGNFPLTGDAMFRKDGTLYGSLLASNATWTHGKHTITFKKGIHIVFYKSGLVFSADPTHNFLWEHAVYGAFHLNKMVGPVLHENGRLRRGILAKEKTIELHEVPYKVSRMVDLDAQGRIIQFYGSGGKIQNKYIQCDPETGKVMGSSDEPKNEWFMQFINEQL